MSIVTLLLGAGPAGANYIRELQRIWDLDLVGFTNRSEGPRTKVSQQTGKPGRKPTRTFDQSPVRPKMVVIATANTTHEDFEALEAGLDVFCEKPIHDA